MAITTTSPKVRPIAFDLCCNVGGASAGVVAAGYNLTHAFDFDELALEWHHRNHPATQAIAVDLTDEMACRRAFPGFPPYYVHCSPPCQSFSTQGRQNINDPRRDVYCQAIARAISTGAKAISVENVKSITYVKHRPVLEAAIAMLEDAGYNVLSIVLDASHYEVPQVRLRHWLIAHRQFMPLPPPMSGQLPKTVRDAFTNLPPRRWKPVRHTAEVVARFNRLQPGDRCSVGWQRRLYWDKPSYTLTAGSRHGAGSNGYHTPRSPVHPFHPRLLDVREWIRLQGLPDNWQLPQSRGMALHCIGEGVPPGMAEAVARSLLPRG